MQQLIKPIWALYFGGCILTRDTRPSLMKAGFKQVDVKNTYPSHIPWMFRPHLLGVATK